MRRISTPLPSLARVQQLVKPQPPLPEYLDELERREDERAVLAGLPRAGADAVVALAVHERFGAATYTPAERAAQRLRMSQALARLVAEGDVSTMDGTVRGRVVCMYVAVTPSEHMELVGYAGETER